MAAKLTEMGYPLAGFNVYTVSDVLSGSGLSSSAAYETFIGNVINGLFYNGELDAVTIAKAGNTQKMFILGNPAG